MHTSRRLILNVTGVMVIATLLMLAVSNAGAQVCLGLSDRNSAVQSVSGGVTRFPSATNMSVRGGFATRRAFAGIRASATTFPDTADSEALIVGLDFGWTFALGRNKNFNLCPTLDWSYQIGPNRRRTVSLDYRIYTWTPAMTLARQVDLNDDFVLLLFLTGSFQLVGVNTRQGVTRATTTSHHQLVGGGTGLQFRKTFVLRASAEQPINLEGARPAYRVVLGYLFNLRRPGDGS